MPRSRSSRRKMRGGLLEGLFGSNQEASSSSPIDNFVNNLQKGATDTISKLATSTKDNADKAGQYITTSADSLVKTAKDKSTDLINSVNGTGGRRRRKIRGGNSVIPASYKFGVDAMEVNNIRMAKPQTMVGGRRRRRKSSRRRSATRRRSRSRRSGRSRSSRRN